MHAANPICKVTWSSRRVGEAAERDRVVAADPVGQMPKPLYGKGRKSKSRAGQSSDDAGHGWLTLITTLPEEQMHAAILVALREGG